MFQKRGLPHAHIVIILVDRSKLQKSEDIDLTIFADFFDPITHPDTYNTVTRCSVHGPCGVEYPSAPYMEDGICTQRYPRAFSNDTSADQDGYPVYRRRHNGSFWEYEGTSCGQSLDCSSYHFSVVKEQFLYERGGTLM